MPRVRPPLVALLTVALITGCSASGATTHSASPSVYPPVTVTAWNLVSDAGVPQDLRKLEPNNVAGWAHGFLVSGTDLRTMSGRTVFSSKEGRIWTADMPPQINQPADWAVAGYADAGYVLGTRLSSPTVWRTTAPHNWQAITLPSTPVTRLLGIAAGPHGVVALGIMNHEDRNEFVSNDGYVVWHSADGITFEDPTVLAVNAPEEPFTSLSANADGFMIVGGGRETPFAYASIDAKRWDKIANDLGGLDDIGPAASNGSTRVVFGYRSPGDPHSPRPVDPAHPPGTAVLYQVIGQSAWQRGRLAPGRLPDAGVAPITSTYVNNVLPIGLGFVATGWSGGDAAVWISQDGRDWTKEPVRANQFVKAEVMAGLAISGSKLLLVGQGASNKIWIGQVTGR